MRWRTVQLARQRAKTDAGKRPISIQTVEYDITNVFERGIAPGEPVDLVFVVDTTGSMGDDIDAVKADMQRILRELTARNPDRRIGVVAYRDRGDSYVSRTMLAISADDAQIRRAIAHRLVRLLVLEQLYRGFGILRGEPYHRE